MSGQRKSPNQLMAKSVQWACQDAPTIQKRPYGHMRTMLSQEKAAPLKVQMFTGVSPVNPATIYTMEDGMM